MPADQSKFSIETSSDFHFTEEVLTRDYSKEIMTWRRLVRRVGRGLAAIWRYSI